MTTKPTTPVKLDFAEAIARMEGFYVPGSRAARNCNPGNLNWDAFAQRHGALHCEADGATYKGRFAVFPDAATGFAALRALLLGPTYSNLTVGQALLRYAPPADHNDTVRYVQNVCTWLGCDSDEPVKELV